MTSLDRKANSQQILAKLGMELKHDLPPLEEEDQLTFRSSNEVAQRILILTYLNCVANDPSLKQEVMVFLIGEKLWDKATEEERQLFHKTPLSEDELTIILWRAEAIWLLLWVINKVDVLDVPAAEVNLHAIFANLPGFFEPTHQFIASATRRPASAILDQYDLMFRLTWALKENNVPGMNPGVAFERYFALNWVAGGEWKN
ncbi:MAG TPA: DUF4272 domain-containing protein [Chryseosolibacter sp.]